MASQKVSAGDALGQAQMRKPDDHEFLNKTSDALGKQALDNLSNSQSPTNDTTYTSQASSFIQQTGEQVKNMAQGAGEQVKNIAIGAADAVKNTLGMNTDNNNNSGNNNNSSNNTTTDFASGGTTAAHPSNPRI